MSSIAGLQFSVANPLNPIDFVAKYGQCSKDLEYVTALGELPQYITFYIVVIFLGLFGSVLLIAKSQPEVDPVTKNPVEPTTMNKVLNVVGKGVLALTVISALYVGYLYLFKHLPEFAKWFSCLYAEGKVKYGMFRSLSQTQYRFNQGNAIFSI